MLKMCRNTMKVPPWGQRNENGGTTSSIFLNTFGKTDLLHRGFSPVNRSIKNKRALAIKRIKC